MPSHPLYPFIWRNLKTSDPSSLSALATLTSNVTLNRIDSVNTCPCIFFLRNHRRWCALDTWCHRECLLHKRLWKQPPIATKALETKWQFLEKLKNFAPVSLWAKSSGVISLLAQFSLLAYFLKISFPENHIFFIKSYFLKYPNASHSFRSS